MIQVDANDIRTLFSKIGDLADEFLGDDGVAAYERLRTAMVGPQEPFVATPVADSIQVPNADMEWMLNKIQYLSDGDLGHDEDRFAALSDRFTEHKIGVARPVAEADGDPVGFLLVRGYDEYPVGICLDRAGAESAVTVLHKFSTDTFAVKEVSLFEQA